MISTAGAIGKMYALASAAFEKCGVWEQSYKINRDTANYSVESRFGTDEVSQRVADHVTSGGDVSNSIGKVNEVTTNLVQNCGYTEELVPKVLGGGINQNIIDSVEIYKGMSIKEVPEFGELTPIIGALAFGSFIVIQKRREIKHYMKKLAQHLIHRQSGRGTGVLPS